MIVIIEGPDGAGKSMLARQLADRYGLAYHHEGPPPVDTPVLEHYGWLLEEARHESVVFDRFALGERVYGPLHRGEDRLGADGWRVFMRLAKSVGAFHILCLPAYKTCLASWSSGRPEMITNERTFRASYGLFKALGADAFQYDWQSSFSWSDLKQSLDYHQLNVRPMDRGVVGSRTAKCLIVGDRGSQPDTKTTDLPFFGTSNSSRYLTRAMDIAEIDEDDVAFVNAHRWDGKHVMWHMRGWERVVPLGKNAAQDCVYRGLQRQIVHPVPHPQYWARFHHHDVYTYAALLKKAVKGCS